jgi:hypothetical protein
LKFRAIFAAEISVISTVAKTVLATQKKTHHALDINPEKAFSSS